MKKSLLGLSLLALALQTMPAGAEELSPAEALARFNNSEVIRRVAGAGPQMRLAYTADADGMERPAFYVFDKPAGGYIILSADDRLAQLLADVDNGSFDYASLPENLRWWLSEYSREIGWYLSQPESETTKAEMAKASMKDNRVPIDPLLETKWDQNAPYNNLCPMSGDTRSMTGCVATAMAQIMKFHEWPAVHGYGSHTYYDNGRRITYDFENSVFDWANMLDCYSGILATDDQKRAVANLMLACGVSVDMGYDAEASGAFSMNIAPAMRTFFGYADCTSSQKRDTYSLWEWEELMYEEMAAFRPVCYSGVGKLGGHQFVIDGYRGESLFHVNWGWNGLSNGYFRLTSLNPPGLGIGGGGGSFDYYQEAVLRICKPDQAGDMKPFCPIYIRGNMTVQRVTDYGDQGNMINLNFQRGAMYGAVYEDYPGTFGLILRDDHENEIGFYEIEDITFPASTTGDINGLASVSGVMAPVTTPGTYRVYPGFRPEGADYYDQIPVYNGYNQYIMLTVSDDLRMSFVSNGLKDLPELEIMNLVIPNEIRQGVETKFLVDALNGSTQYDGMISLYILTDEERDLLVSSANFNIEPYIYNLYEFPVTFDVEPGEYQVYVTDTLNRRISSNFPITVLPEQAGIDAVGEESEVASEWYDLQGRRLNERPAEPGLYIERRGTQTLKVAI